MSTEPVYGLYDPDKHGQFNAPSPAAVAEGVPGGRPQPHLHVHRGGRPECTFPGCDEGTPSTARCLVPAAHGAYPNGTADCDVPGHHMGGAA